MSLKSIVRALGGDLYDGGRRANVPAPGHSRRDRSVSLLERGGRLIIHTFGDSDWRAVRDDLRDRGLLGPAPNDASPTPPAVDTVGDQARTAAALALWEAGRPVGGTLSERHLRLRGQRAPFPGSDVLRHHGLVPLSIYGHGSRTLPALLAAIRDPGGALTAIEVAYLGPGGGKAAGLRLPRKTVGQVPRGSAVRVDPVRDTLLVAEGLMTTLSARRRFNLPAWALLSTSNLRFWQAPQGVRSVLIAGDRGVDGEASAARLARCLRAAGVTARVALPPLPFGDWNEATPATDDDQAG